LNKIACGLKVGARDKAAIVAVLDGKAVRDGDDLSGDGLKGYGYKAVTHSGSLRWMVG